MMMTDQPARVSPDDISTLLTQLAALSPDATLRERLDFHEHKAQLLTRIAAMAGTTDAHDVAAEAWFQCQQLARRIAAEGEPS